MAFIDEIAFHAKAGHGGSGVVRWRHERSKEFSGAAGGNGGPGGDVYVRAVRDTAVLARQKSYTEFSAGDGQDGANWSRQGGAGTDIYIDLPIGSIITNKKTGRVVELLEDGHISKILHGGRGGLGNEHFKASTNVRPEQSTPGYPGEEADFTVELSLIADAGFIGLPNAGKSSLLNALTKAKAKVGNYAFTTLDPNLGSMHGYILADIPGLIEGASEGKGLGHKFLRHVKRTRVLFHLVSLEDVHNLSKMEHNYTSIRKELEKYDKELAGDSLAQKKETIILSKTDVVESGPAGRELIEAARHMLSTYNQDILEVSVLDDESVKRLAEDIVKRVSLDTRAESNQASQ